jgi:hypothetical protein
LDNSANKHINQPRALRYRSHYKVYLFFFAILSFLNLSFWGYQLWQRSWIKVYQEFNEEFWLSCCFFIVISCFYFFWLKYRLNRAVQAYPDRLAITNGKKSEEIKFSEIESVGIICRSLFYLRMGSGIKHYFSSSLERIDYIWEGLREARPDLVSATEYEEFRLKLVQYDHHQKRKDWFFRHRLVDLFNWLVLPLAFMLSCFIVQSRDIFIHQPGLYFFRLIMYSALVLLVTTFIFSMLLKRFIFDKKIVMQMNAQPDDKLRDIEFEGVILQRSKLLQMATVCFAFSLIIRTEVNLFSITKIRSDITSFKIKNGRNFLVDNRYNCFNCRYSVQDGDLLIFGRGVIGQMMAKEGEMVGEIAQDIQGRIIASEHIQEVPEGHVAIKMAKNGDVVMVKVADLIGKLQK